MEKILIMITLAVRIFIFKIYNENVDDDYYHYNNITVIEILIINPLI